uniref:Polynucleotide adenylyltransferase n=1 Tax=Meloidogyne incognita TaxID=6306 RepID=A0A914MIS7_MELIC
MLTKVFLLYPEANVIELIERYFITFSTWDWHYPLRIKNKQNKEEKQEKNITIYTTTHPEHSITSKITKTNQHIILNALIFGNYFY